MEESSLTAAPSILDGDNYETWATRMRVHLQALDVWQIVEENYEVPPLGANPTVAQMKLYKERKTRNAKVKACLFVAKMKESDAVKDYGAQLLSIAIKLVVGQFVEKGFKVYFEDRNCIIKVVEGKEVFNIKMKDKSFALNLLEDEHAVVLQQDSTTMLWHRRLGRFHHDVVLYMKKNQIVERFPDLENDLPISATCQYGKQTKLSFPKKTSWRET
ncbi:hypothetical protein AAG906_038636 [Vitis piasezkii]